jgi:hypothetical protein
VTSRGRPTLTEISFMTTDQSIVSKGEDRLRQGRSKD